MLHPDSATTWKGKFVGSLTEGVAQIEQRWRDLTIAFAVSAPGATFDWLEFRTTERKHHIVAAHRFAPMSFRPTLLSNYPVMHSSNPEFIRDRLFHIYGANSFDIGKGTDELLVRANHLQIGGLGLSYGDYSGDVSLGFGESTIVRQIFNIQGAGRYSIGGGPPGEIAPGSCTPVLPAHRPLKFDYKSRYRQLVLQIEFDALLRNLERLAWPGDRQGPGIRPNRCPKSGDAGPETQGLSFCR